MIEQKGYRGIEIEPGYKVFRIRKYTGVEGGANFYYHADVIAMSEEEALAAAEAGKVTNWRRIDSFDVAVTDYCYYEPLGEVEFDRALKPSKPLT